VVTLFDDHDQVRKGDRKARFCAGGRTHQAVVGRLGLTHDHPGIPCIYYGSEQALTVTATATATCAGCSAASSARFARGGTSSTRPRLTGAVQIRTAQAAPALAPRPAVPAPDLRRWAEFRHPDHDRRADRSVYPWSRFSTPWTGDQYRPDQRGLPGWQSIRSCTALARPEMPVLHGQTPAGSTVQVQTAQGDRNARAADSPPAGFRSRTRSQIYRHPGGLVQTAAFTTCRRHRTAGQ
jgi:hypothetical protein